MQETYFNITSRERLANQVTHNFTYVLEGRFRDVFSIELISLEIPIHFYNIRDYNNTFTEDRIGTPFTATLTNGNYDFGEFKTEWESKMDANGAGLTHVLTENTITGKLSWTVSLATTIIATTLSSQLGFISPFAALTTHNGSNIYTLSNDNNFFIVIKNFQSDYISKNGFTFKVPANAGFLDVLYYYNTDTRQIAHSNKMGISLAQLEIEIRDFADNLLDLNGCDWSMTLKLKFC